ncbi:hypothetical protein POM88_001339 [Heracleum sosnowskyi]|uniref:CTLH domain-containing protein n=1 Tax=Heracleum sosnowskyi TaxID=360622 RepID=A0AAD8N9K2_9APIA|nr:hypothetical protein POM88_001339 [Heracleum sosnowskyi]
MDSLSKDLVLLVLQFLLEEKYNDTVHTLEKESGFFFNMRYFEEKVDAGEWDDAEKYLSGFTKVEDNRYSMKIYYELRRQKYLEALDRKDKPEALDILLKDLKVFSTYNIVIYRDMTQLLTLDNFRENEKLSKHGNTKEARSIMMTELKDLIKANPLLTDKLAFPIVKSSRLRTLINQSLSWQHHWCTNPRSIPDITTLFKDHSCRSTNGAFENSPVNIQATGGAMPSAYVQPFPVPTSAANTNGLAGRVTNSSTASISVQHGVVPTQVSGMKRAFTPPVTLGMFEFRSTDDEQLPKRLRTAQPIEEATNPAVGQRSSQSLDGSLTLGSLAALNSGETAGRNREISNPVENVVGKAKPWKLTETTDPIPWRLLSLDASDTGNKVSRLLYTNSGTGILVLGSNGLQKMWKWVCDVQNLSGKATAKFVPEVWKSKNGFFMANDIAGVDLQEACPCVDISKNDSYVMSACGGKISLFNMISYRVMTTVMSPPPVPTAVAFHPRDNNIVVVGMADSIIYTYDVRTDEVKSILKGHQKRVTSLAFSTKLNILISSGADTHICIWSIDTWEKRKSIPLQLPTGHLPTGDARVQFHSDQVRFLVSHETQLALYDATNVDRIQQYWIPQDVLSAPISYAAFSCNSQLIFASFYDGNVGIFDADSLSLRCWISPSMYLPQGIQGSDEVVYPVVVAPHPHDPYQFALGLTDGSVKVIEPFEPEGNSRVISQLGSEVFANDRGASTSKSNYADEQVQR